MLRKHPTPKADAAHGDAIKYDSRAQSLIASMEDCRAAATDELSAAGAQLSTIINELLSHSQMRLCDAATSYRSGMMVAYVLDDADEALQMVDGLLGRAWKTKLQQVGTRLRAMDIELRGLESAGSRTESVALARQLFDSAVDNVTSAYRSRKDGYRTMFQPDIERAITALDRAAEALAPDSAGVSFVRRLDALRRAVAVR